MAFPETFSTDPVGTAGSDLNGPPNHFNAHAGIAEWIGAAEPHIGKTIAAWPEDPTLEVEGSDVSGSHFGVYRKMGTLCWFQAGFQPASAQDMGFETVRFSLPFPMVGSNAIAMGQAFITSTTFEYIPAAWRASPAAGFGNQVGVLYAPGSQFTTFNVQGFFQTAS